MEKTNFTSASKRGEKKVETYLSVSKQVGGRGASDQFLVIN
jgi:hypothetical protein